MAFIDNEDGSVTDTVSNLTWKQAPSEKLVLFDTAVAEAPAGWRLPTLAEYQTLIADQKANVAGCAAAFGAGNLPTAWFWVYKIDPGRQNIWNASAKTAEDAEIVALEKPGHVAALFSWMGFTPANRRLEAALARYVLID